MHVRPYVEQKINKGKVKNNPDPEQWVLNVIPTLGTCLPLWRQEGPWRKMQPHKSLRGKAVCLVSSVKAVWTWDKYMAISPKIGLFRISRKLHFRGCNHGKQHVSLPHGKGRRALLQGGERWEGASKQSPRLFLFCRPVTKLCPTPCYPMDSSMPGFPVLHCLPEFAQIHVSDAIQVSHPLLSPSPPAFNLSQHQGLFWWVDSSHQVAKVLKLQLQDQSFQWIFRLSPYQERRDISFSCQSLLLSQDLRAPLFGLHTLFNRRFCLFFIPAFNKPRTWGLRESDMTKRCHFNFSLNKPSPTCLSLSKIWMDGQNRCKNP